MARAPGAAVGGRTQKGRGARGSARAASKAKGLKRIGIVDTSFSRYDMASAAIDELRKQGGGFVIERYTVPGIKDLAAGARILFDRGCDLVLALGMVGRQPVDKDCALAADFGLQAVQANVGRHILGVMVHEEEATDEARDRGRRVPSRGDGPDGGEGPRAREGARRPGDVRGPRPRHVRDSP